VSSFKKGEKEKREEKKEKERKTKERKDEGINSAYCRFVVKVRFSAPPSSK
jgi:hypothetical protein